VTLPAPLRSLLVALIAVALPAALLLGAMPAGALERPAIRLKLGDHVSYTGPAMSGNNYAMGRRPSSCAGTRTSCDTIRVTLDVPVEELQANTYMLVVTTSWQPKADPNIQQVGRVASDNQVNTYVYTDPPRKDSTGAEVEETSAFMVPGPNYLTVFKPETQKWAIVIENMYGLNTGYTVTVDLTDIGSGPGVDRSVDEPVVDYSDDSNIAVTPSFQDAVVPQAVASGRLSSGSVTGTMLGAGALTFNVLPPPVDDELDRIAGIDDQANFTLGEARTIAKVTTGPPKARSAGALTLLVWFVFLPIVLGGASSAFVIRRRRALVS
jgi:hypothetical protein